MINKEQLLKIVDEIVAAPFENPFEDPRDIAGKMFDNMPKRRPYLFLITTQHNDEFTMNSMVYYLEPNQDPKEFKEESSAHLRSVYGSGTISLRSIKL